MAAQLPQAQAATTSISSPNSQPEAAIGDRWQFPKGPCNFRESSFRGGIKCGCRRFWTDRTVGGSGSTNAGIENGVRNGQVTWCMCKHHACFHDEEPRPSSSSSAPAVPSSGLEVAPVHVHRRDGDCTTGSPLCLFVRSPAGLSRGSTILDPSIFGDNDKRPASNGGNTASSSLIYDQGVGQPLQETASAIAAAEQALLRPGGQTISVNGAAQAQASSSGMPPIPSQCLLSSQYLRPYSLEAFQGDGGKALMPFNAPSDSNGISAPAEASHHHTGLGLSLITENSEADTERIESAATSAHSSFVRQRPLEDHESHLQSKIEQELSSNASNIRNSSSAQSTPCAASMISMFQPTQHKRSQALWKTHPLIPPRNNLTRNTGGEMAFPPSIPEDTMQTEVATPSQQGTPDLRALDNLEMRKTVKELIGMIDLLDQEVRRIGGSITRVHRSPPLAPNDNSRDQPQVISTKQLSTAISPRQPPNTDTKSDDLISSLSFLLPSLKPLLTAYLTVLGVIKSYAGRLDVLENVSFSNAPVEDLQQKVELAEDRVLDLEGKVDELEKWRTSHDEDGISNTGKHRSRRWKIEDEAVNVTAQSTSFVSTASAATNASNTSLALVAAAIDRKEMLSRIEVLSSRLHELEASAPPSPACPWEIEVVFIPWGRNMKGIWFPTDNFPASSSGSLTQMTEDWMQTQGPIELSRRGSMQLLDEKSGGWSETAIRRWAKGTETWMVPRACGERSRIYERLLSRGLVRTIQVTGNGAADVQSALIAAFGPLVEALNGSQSSPAKASHSSFSSRNEDIPLPLGLNAPFIPLRKLHKDSRLRFLNPEEILTSALWTVDFLSSSTIMMATGGRKRLFVTNADGYIQYNRDEQAGWTWQRLRELPRVRPAPSETSGGQVHEADAKEACWEWDWRLDPQVSSTSSSFASNASHGSSQLSFQLKHSPPSPDRHSSDESEPNVHKSPRPISPVSQFPHSNHHHRTSTPHTIPTTSLSKRRTPSNDHNLSSSPTKPLALKRRRTSRSPTFDTTSVPDRPIWTSTPRRSNPPSPFFSEIGVPYPGSSTAATAAGGARRGTTPFAYATPHSGPIVTDNRKKREEEEDVWEGVESEAEELVEKVEKAWEGLGGEGESALKGSGHGDGCEEQEENEEEAEEFSEEEIDDVCWDS
ncbi:MAG: hypothetical protein M1840_003987 [Geoglossum simile]|nr:MAG: hypothetical protein M1840_003987 [Geoglossum simile]